MTNAQARHELLMSRKGIRSHQERIDRYETGDFAGEVRWTPDNAHTQSTPQKIGASWLIEYVRPPAPGSPVPVARVQRLGRREFSITWFRTGTTMNFTAPDHGRIADVANYVGRLSHDAEGI